MWIYDPITNKKTDIPNAWIFDEQAETVGYFDAGDSTKITYAKKVYKSASEPFYKGAAGDIIDAGKLFLIAAALGLAVWTSRRK